MEISVLVAALVGYLLGSIPFGLLLTRMAGLGDVRKIGSGNIGATNVLRTGNKSLAGATLVLDAGKAALAVLLARYFFGEAAAMIAGFSAFVGHIFPVWLSFKGGKGVAAMIGALLALFWPVGLIFCAIWLFMALVVRYSSLAALVAAATAPVFSYFLSGWALGLTALGLSVLLFYRHSENIKRLLNGSEPKIGSSGKSGAPDK
ncbi:Acyl-phosphate:glycerol-3-phosphate O-acyltransferase PlsY (EC 2.3.1.n3) [hydrothermal vent metagenome]|uniref:Acyl-phosphate:glycerol-3-phosphate O-acyltransferase PlsY n=1 Tax=hydrothermal vent metagenome TaxID=652676 RepID=A0A3B0TAM0_9ZZZZ